MSMRLSFTYCSILLMRIYPAIIGDQAHNSVCVCVYRVCEKCFTIGMRENCYPSVHEDSLCECMTKKTFTIFTSISCLI